MVDRLSKAEAQRLAAIPEQFRNYWDKMLMAYAGLTETQWRAEMRAKAEDEETRRKNPGGILRMLEEEIRNE